MNKMLFKSKMFLKSNSSTILTCIGGVGVVATVVTAVKATPKALIRIEEAKEEKGEELTKKESDSLVKKYKVFVRKSAHFFLFFCLLLIPPDIFDA